MAIIPFQGSLLIQMRIFELETLTHRRHWFWKKVGLKFKSDIWNTFHIKNFLEKWIFHRFLLYIFTYNLRTTGWFHNASVSHKGTSQEVWKPLWVWFGKNKWSRIVFFRLKSPVFHLRYSEPLGGACWVLLVHAVKSQISNFY